MNPTELKGAARWRWLRSAARRAAQHPRDRADQVIALGKLLAAAKRVVGHGGWREWIRENLPFSYRIVAEAIRAAKVMDSQSCTARNFGPSAIRVLTNRRFSKTSVNQAVSKPTDSKKPLGCTAAILRILEHDRRISAPQLAAMAEDGPSDEERTFLQLAQLAAGCTMLHFAFDHDEDSPSVTLTAFRLDDRREHVVRRTLAGALAAAVGQEEVRRCPKCTLVKTLDAFARSTSYCRICERERVRRAAASASRN